VKQITLEETIKKIQKLIELNSGDTGRLQHIIDFLNKGKPLYKTDKIYLEKKLNSTIKISPKKIIHEENTSIIQIKELMKKGKGDTGRLQHIINTLQNKKPMYLSDGVYLETNFGIKVIQKLEKIRQEIITNEKSKIEIKDKLKERIVMPKDWKKIDDDFETNKITKKLKRRRKNSKTK